MKILFERYTYPTERLATILPTQYFSCVGDKSTIDIVGYYHHFERDETVLIFPKIFVENGCFLGNIPLYDFLEKDALEVLQQYEKTPQQTNFIYKFSLDFYLSLRQFQERNASNTIVEAHFLKNIVSNIEANDYSELDLVFSILRFYQENRDLIIFKQKESEQLHFKKTNWAKTIRTQVPVLANHTALYTQTKEKSYQIDQEDELLTIFFSVLHQFSEKYGFQIRIDSAWNILPENDFETKSLRTLKKIKNQYFSDKFKKLLTLLLIYFERKNLANSKQGVEEYILCYDYEIVFEDMIDRLLSDTRIAKKLKEQADGKIVDHIFGYPSFFENEYIYYIGDSKYYKDTTSYSSYSIYKQFTYAKNVIQYHIDAENKKQNIAPFRYRDTLTEGYNPTPNFFIQAFIHPENVEKIEDYLQIDEQKKSHYSFHFENRLFDRDSFILLHFKINYFFVLSCYVEQDTSVLHNFAEQAKKIIRNDFVEQLKSRYDFYSIDLPTPLLPNFLHELRGKCYAPNNTNAYVALQKGYEGENTHVQELIDLCK